MVTGTASFLTELGWTFRRERPGRTAWSSCRAWATPSTLPVTPPYATPPSGHSVSHDEEVDSSVDNQAAQKIGPRRVELLVADLPRLVLRVHLGDHAQQLLGRDGVIAGRDGVRL